MITITPKEFEQFISYIKSEYGLNLIEKKHLLEGRLQNELLQHNFTSFTEYFNYIMGDKTGNAVVDLLNKVTTNHTFFLRENDHFNFLRDKVLPYMENTITSKDLRIWSAGCSSGEEPYTIAMILADFFHNRRFLWDSKVLATDISHKVLQRAAEGIYSAEQVTVLPDAWRKIYFTKRGPDSYAVADAIRNEVIFRIFNLTNQVFPFKKKFHVIFCRNVMIYFDIPTKQELIQKFYDCTEPGGYLFIGHAESINRENTRYKYVMPAVYRKE
jgi:chemotaxis protein methyltransferase CheR